MEKVQAGLRLYQPLVLLIASCKAGPLLPKEGEFEDGFLLTTCRNDREIRIIRGEGMFDAVRRESRAC
jgi:hypothetical protein